MYCRNLDALSFSGSPAPRVEFDPDGPTAKRAFLLYDSQGRLGTTSQPELLQRVLASKASLNLHVRMWAEGVTEGTLMPVDVFDLRERLELTPKVMRAVRGAARRMGAWPSWLDRIDDPGWVPVGVQFARAAA